MTAVANDSSDIKSHQETEHKGEKQNSEYHTCVFCSSVFTSTGSLVKHMRDKHENHGWESCDSVFSSPYSLALHCEEKHEDTNHKRELCSSSSSPLAKRKEKKLNINRCEVCNLAFSSLNSLALHKCKEPATLIFVCDICSSTFPSVSLLAKHKEETHKSHTCEICWKFYSLNYLEKRKRMKHSTVSAKVTGKSLNYY